MNPLHYPSLELCKKLTQVGFPIVDTYRNSYGVYSRREEGFAKIPTDYTCPSVMDMLDVIPKYIDSYFFEMYHNSCRYMELNPDGSRSTILGFGTTKTRLPNMLAEAIIWLSKSGRLSFNK